MSRDAELYGPLWDPGSLEQAALEQIKKWEAAHLAAKEREDGLDPQSLKPAVNKDAGGVFDWQPTNKLPMLLLVVGDVSMQTSSARSNSGELELEVTVVVEGRNLGSAKRTARRLAAAYSSILLAHPAFDPCVASVEWERDEGEILEQKPPPGLGAQDGRRVVAAARVLTVTFNGGSAGRGATAPPVNPYDPSTAGPVATDVDLHTAT